MTTAIASPPASTQTAATPDAISAEAPLHVLIAGAGVGGLILANCLEMSGSPVKYTILERTKEFKKFGGPIQLASNAMQGLRSIDETLYKQIESHATWTGNRTNGIKDGIRDEWYAKFDLKTPAADRSMPFTCVVTAILANGEEVHGDVLIGADGIWSKVRATMNSAEPRDGSAYSGYTVFAGELEYGGGDPECGYKVYIGPQQYFVITDIGRGRYQWYAFLT